MKFIIAQKLNMSTHFLESGTAVPVTILKTGAVVVTQLKDKEKHGYQAVQVGFGKKKNISKPVAGHVKGLGKFKGLKEFKVSDLKGFELGKKMDLSDFQIGEFVDAIGIEKGAGFTGTVKRYDFGGMPKTHGHDKPRAVGSIGQRFPQHVRKGLRMAGRMGGHAVTVKNLQIIDIDPKKNLIALKGAVPGHRNNIVQIVSTGRVKELEAKKAESKEKKK